MWFGQIEGIVPEFACRDWMTMIKLSYDSWSLDWDLNSELSGYIAGVLTAMTYMKKITEQGGSQFIHYAHHYNRGMAYSPQNQG
jgi:hypothetical protein